MPATVPIEREPLSWLGGPAYGERVTDGRVLVVGSLAPGSLVPRLAEVLAHRDVDTSAAEAVPGLPLEDVDLGVDAAAEGRSVHAVVFAPSDDALTAPHALSAEFEWHTIGESLLLLGLHVAQTTHRVLVEGGRLVFVLPDVGISGGADHVALGTAVEGLRALAKSAGRQWAERGITTASLLVPTDPDRVDVEAVADVIASLLGPAGDALTGVTLPVDGGSLMVP
jgi:3-oxoacyl-[acyl-carrier protein] reductase